MGCRGRSTTLCGGIVFLRAGRRFLGGVVMGGPMSGLPVEVVEVAFQLHVVEAVLS